jgi:hypothetical protein
MIEMFLGSSTELQVLCLFFVVSVVWTLLKDL